jgi:hypothetical protein
MKKEGGILPLLFFKKLCHDFSCRFYFTIKDFGKPALQFQSFLGTSTTKRWYIITNCQIEN